MQGGLSFKTYFVRKVLRLLPLVGMSAVVYEILLFIYADLYGFNWSEQKASLWGMVLDALGIQCGWSSLNPCVNNPTWYISVLLLCYIIFYVITYWSNKLKISPYYGYVFMIFVGIGIITYGISKPFLTYDSARGYYAFFFGILLHKITDCKCENKKLTVAAWSVFITITLLMIFCWEVVNTDINYIFTFLYYPAIIVILKSAFFSRILNINLWGELGEISFNVYIWHIILMLAALIAKDILGFAIPFGRVRAMLLFTLLCFVAGTVSHYLIEKTIYKMVKKLNV